MLVERKQRKEVIYSFKEDYLKNSMNDFYLYHIHILIRLFRNIP